MPPKRRRAGAVAAAVLVAAMLALALGAGQVSVVVLDVPERQATLVVKRSAPLGMGLFESEQTLCSRQGPGSPLVSATLPMAFCPVALAASPALRGRNLLLRAPFSRVLHGWAS